MFFASAFSEGFWPPQTQAPSRTLSTDLFTPVRSPLSDVGRLSLSARFYMGMSGCQGSVNRLTVIFLPITPVAPDWCVSAILLSSSEGGETV